MHTASIHRELEDAAGVLTARVVLGKVLMFNRPATLKSTGKISQHSVSEGSSDGLEDRYWVSRTHSRADQANSITGLTRLNVRLVML